MSYEPLLRIGFAHEQTANVAVYYVRNRFKKRQRFRRVIETLWREPSVERIASADNLIRVYYDLQSRAGQAPGPDGFTYTDWSRREVAIILRKLSRAVCAGDYRPQPSRPVPIPKLRGGFRTLRISNLCDRVLAAAVHEAMEFVWEPVFLPWSMGFRPGRGVLRLLAELEHVMLEQDRWVLAIDDIQKAFDNVPIDDVMADHTQHIQNTALLSLIRVVLRGGDGEKRARGIDQGSAYSPTALNVRLHHAHDLGVEQGHYPPRYRYADNLVYICQDVPEGHQALEKSRELLEKTGFALKGEDGPPMDLREGMKAQLLGLTLSRRESGLGFNLGEESWTKLTQSLKQAHETDDPADIARKVVKGWITSYGPAFESLRNRTLDRVLGITTQHGFRETCSRETLMRWWRDSWENWNTFRERVMRVSRRAST